MPPLSSSPNHSGDQPSNDDQELKQLEASRPAVGEALPSGDVSRNHSLANRLAIVVAVIFALGGGGIALAFLSRSTSPKNEPDAKVEALGEAVGQPGGALPLTDLSVTSLQAQAAVIQNLTVTGSAEIQGNLGVAGNGVFGGTLEAANFQGSGAGLTGVNASLLDGHGSSYFTNLGQGLTSLQTGVALLSGPNTFTRSNNFAAGLTASSLTLGQPLSVSDGGLGLNNIPGASVLYGQGGSTLGYATPVAAGLCLVSGTTNDSWGSCSGVTGVATLDGLTGIVALANSSGAGNAVTINDASTSSKGLAEFSPVNFTAVGGVVNTIQSIAVASTPSFAGLSLASALQISSGGTGTDTLTADGVLVGNGTSPVSSITAGSAGDCLVSTAGAPAWQSCGGGGGGANTSLSNLSALAINSTLLPGSPGAVDLGSGTLPFGNLYIAGSSGTPGTNNFEFSGASTHGTDTITIPDASGTICLTTGNCVGTGGAGSAVGGSGAAGTLAEFTGTGDTIGNSSITDDGTSVAIAPTSNSTAAFRVQNAGGNSLLNVDTTNQAFSAGTTAEDDGYTNEGNTDTGFFGNGMVATKFTTTGAGALKSVTIFFTQADTAPHNKFQVAIYTDGASCGGLSSCPATEIAASGDNTINSFQWNTVPITATLAAGTSYWIAINNNGTAGGDYNNVVADAGSGAYVFDSSQTYGTWPGTFPAPGFTSSTAELSAYASVLSSSDSPALVTDSSGNIAIDASTTNPEYTLSVNSPGYGTGALAVQGYEYIQAQSLYGFDVYGPTTSGGFDFDTVNSRALINVNPTWGGAYTAGTLDVRGAGGSPDIVSLVNVGGDATAAFTNEGQLDLFATTDSTDEFDIQNAASNGNVFDVDSVSGRVGINQGGSVDPSYTLDVNGDTNISSGSEYLIGGSPICTSSGCTVAGSSAILNQTTQQTNANFNIQSAAVGSVTATMQAAAAGTASVLEVEDGSSSTGSLITFDNSSGVPLGDVNSSGNLHVSNTIDTLGNTNLNIANGNATSVSIGNSSLDNLTTILGSGLVKSAMGLNSTTAFEVQNATSNAIFTVDTSSNSAEGQVVLGKSSTNNAALVFDSSGGANTITISAPISNPTTNQAITLPNASGTICLDSGNCNPGAPKTATEIVAMGSTACSTPASVASSDIAGAGYVASTCSAQTAIQNAISALPAGGGVVYLEDGTYILSGGITLPSNVTLEGAGSDTILEYENGYNASGAFMISLTSNTTNRVLIEDLALNGNRANQTSGSMYGIYATSNSSPGVQIDHVWADSFYGDGITLDSPGSLSNCEASNNVLAGAGFGIYDLENDTSIANCVSSGNTVGFELDANDYAVTGSSAVSNSSYGFFALGQNGALAGDMSDDNGNYGFWISGSYSTISGSTSTRNSGDGILLYGSDETASGNTIGGPSYANQGQGIDVEDNNDVVTGNTIYVYNGSYNGIYVNSNNDTITDNQITGDGGSGYAIKLYILATQTFLSGNQYSGVGATSISDAGNGNDYSGQATADNDLAIQGTGAIDVGTNAQGTATLTVNGGYNSTQLATPAWGSYGGVTYSGTAGSATWGYEITALDGTGETLASSQQTAGSAATTLNATHYNTVEFPYEPGAVQYRIYRTADTNCVSPCNLGLVTTITSGTLASTQGTAISETALADYIGWKDTGFTAGAASPSANTTGGAVFAAGVTAVGVNAGTGLLQGSGGLTATGTVQLNATTSGTTTIGSASAGAISIQGGAGGSTVNDTSGNLTLSTTTSGNISVNAAGTLTLQGAGGTVTVGGTTPTVTTSGATNLAVDTGGAATLALGDANATTINIGSSSSAATAITIGKNSKSSINLDGGGETLNIDEDGAASNVVNISSSNFNANSKTYTINIGDPSSTANTGDIVNTTIGPSSTLSGGTVTGSTILQAQGLSDTISASTTNPTDVIQTADNSTGAFQLQNAGGDDVLDAATSTSNLVNQSSVTGTTAADWTAKNAAAAPTGDTANPYESTSSIKTTASGSTAYSGLQTSAFTSTIAAGTQYQLTFWAKCSTSITTFTYGRQDNGVDINSTSAATCSTSWQQYTAHWTTGGTIASPNIYMDAGTPASATTIWVDGVSLVQTSISAATNYEPGSIYLEGVVSSPTTFENSANSTSAFQVQNASAATVLDVDTLNGRLGVETNTPAYTLDVAGDINTSTQYRIGGVSALSSSDLNFTNASSAATIGFSSPSSIGGNTLSMLGQSSVNTGTGAVGGAIVLQGGTAGGSSANSGGNLTLQGGTATQSGTGGALNLDGGYAGTRIISTLYAYPTLPSWQQVESGAPAVTDSILDICAPDNSGSGCSGAPADAVNTAWIPTITALRAAGITPLYYIATNYGATAESVVEGEIANAISWYGTADPMFDEMAPNGTCTNGGNSIPCTTYYNDLYTYAVNSGAGVVEYNPGTTFGTSAADMFGPDEILQVFEGQYTTFQSLSVPGWMSGYPSSQFAATVTAGTSSTIGTDISDAVADGIGNFYENDETGTPNYSTLPAYWNTEVADAAASDGTQGQVTIGNSNIKNSTSIYGSALLQSATGANSATALQIENASGTQALVLSTNNVATGWNSANATLDVAKDSGTGRSINAAGSINASGADYAEYFTQAKSGALEPGQLVCLNSADLAEACNASSTDQLVGAVSSDPGYVGNDIYNPKDPGATTLVGLVGQVKVNVSTEGGDIEPGDMLTISSQSGVAEKATSPGMTIGSALEGYSGTGTGQIEVYIHVGYYAPSATDSLQSTESGSVQDATDASFASLNVSGAASLTSLSVQTVAVTGNLTVTGLTTVADIEVNGHIVTGGQTPQAIALTSAGSVGAQVSVTGNDTSGTITVTTGDAASGTKSGPTEGDLLQLTFSKAFTSQPRVVVSADDAASAALEAYTSTAQTTSFDLGVGVKPAPNTTYRFTYFVVQ